MLDWNFNCYLCILILLGSALFSSIIPIFASSENASAKETRSYGDEYVPVEWNDLHPDQREILSEEGFNPNDKYEIKKGFVYNPTNFSQEGWKSGVDENLDLLVKETANKYLTSLTFGKTETRFPCHPAGDGDYNQLDGKTEFGEFNKKSNNTKNWDLNNFNKKTVVFCNYRSLLYSSIVEKGSFENIKNLTDLSGQIEYHHYYVDNKNYYNGVEVPIDAHDGDVETIIKELKNGTVVKTILSYHGKYFEFPGNLERVLVGPGSHEFVPTTITSDGFAPLRFMAAYFSNGGAGQTIEKEDITLLPINSLLFDIFNGEINNEGTWHIDAANTIKASRGMLPPELLGYAGLYSTPISWPRDVQGMAGAGKLITNTGTFSSISIFNPSATTRGSSDLPDLFIAKKGTGNFENMNATGLKDNKPTFTIPGAIYMDENSLENKVSPFRTITLPSEITENINSYDIIVKSEKDMTIPITLQERNLTSSINLESKLELKKGQFYEINLKNQEVYEYDSWTKVIEENSVKTFDLTKYVPDNSNDPIDVVDPVNPDNTTGNNTSSDSPNLLPVALIGGGGAALMGALTATGVATYLVKRKKKPEQELKEN